MNTANEDGETPLYFAVRMGEHRHEIQPFRIEIVLFIYEDHFILIFISLGKMSFVSYVEPDFLCVCFKPGFESGSFFEFIFNFYVPE